jgi:hypothetical protein
MQLERLAVVVLLVSVPAIAHAQPASPDLPGGPLESTVVMQDACSDGIVLDDGSAETAYGWVPTVVWGEYVQTFDLSAYGPTVLDTLCVCLSRTAGDDSIDFEVEVYVDGPGQPAPSPAYTVPASAEGVPEWPEGRFYTIELGDAARAVPGAVQHIGIRWNPSVDQFFFICADHSPTDNPAGGFFRDDRASGWGNVLDTSDMIFDDHRAMMIRAVVDPVPWIPTASTAGAAVLVVLMVGVAVLVLGRR